MKINLKLTMPFLAIGIVFLFLGFLLKDTLQLHFGLVWIVIALIALVIRKLK
jgi:hypothetical protein